MFYNGCSIQRYHFFLLLLLLAKVHFPNTLVSLILDEKVCTTTLNFWDGMHKTRHTHTQLLTIHTTLLRYARQN